jgi:hypothetical protein
MAIGDSRKQQIVQRGNTIRAPRGSEEFNLELDDEKPRSAAADEPTVHAHTQLGLRNLGSNQTYGGGATAFGIHRLELEDGDAASAQKPNPSAFAREDKGQTGVRAALQGMDDNWLDAIGDYLKVDSEHSETPSRRSLETGSRTGSYSGVRAGNSSLDFADSTRGAGLAPPKPAGILRKRRKVRTAPADRDPMVAPAYAFLSEEPEVSPDDTVPPVVNAAEQVTRTVDVEAEIRKQRSASAFVDTVMDVKPPASSAQPPGTSFSPPVPSSSISASQAPPLPFGAPPPPTAPQSPYGSHTPAPPFGLKAPPPAPPIPGGTDDARGPTMMDRRAPLNSPPGGAPTVAGVHERRERWGSGSWSASAAHADEAPEAAVSRRRAPVDTPGLAGDSETDELGALFAELNANDSDLSFLTQGTKDTPEVAQPVAETQLPPRPQVDTGTARAQASSRAMMPGRNPTQERPAGPTGPVNKVASSPRSGDSVFALLAGGLTIIAFLFFFAWLFLK